MAITSSAKKAIKRSTFLRGVNLEYKVAMKKAIKAVRKAVSDKLPASEISALLVVAASTIDKAAKKNIIHKNNAARKKSRLSKLATTA